MLSPRTSSVSRHLLMNCSNYSLVMRFSKLSFSRSPPNTEPWIVVVFASFFCFKTSNTALAKRSFSSWSLDKRLLATWNCTRPATMPREVDRVDFVALACSWITLHEFISCPGLANTIVIYRTVKWIFGSFPKTLVWRLTILFFFS